MIVKFIRLYTKKIENLLKIKSMKNSYSKFLFSFISAKIFMDIN